MADYCGWMDAVIMNWSGRDRNFVCDRRVGSDADVSDGCGCDALLWMMISWLCVQYWYISVELALCIRSWSGLFLI